MVSDFQTKNPNLGQFWRALQRKKVGLWPFGLFSRVLVHGNPALIAVLCNLKWFT
jgi:hypothetical protein